MCVSARKWAFLVFTSKLCLPRGVHTTRTSWPVQRHCGPSMRRADSCLGVEIRAEDFNFAPSYYNDDGGGLEEHRSLPLFALAAPTVEQVSRLAWDYKLAENKWILHNNANYSCLFKEYFVYGEYLSIFWNSKASCDPNENSSARMLKLNTYLDSSIHRLILTNNIPLFLINCVRKLANWSIQEISERFMFNGGLKSNSHN